MSFPTEVAATRFVLDSGDYVRNYIEEYRRDCLCGRKWLMDFDDEHLRWAARPNQRHVADDIIGRRAELSRAVARVRGDHTRDEELDTQSRVHGGRGGRWWCLSCLNCGRLW